MRRVGFPEEVLTEETRMEMLRAMTEEDPRLAVTDVEFQHPKHWYAQETMGYNQKQYPEAELLFRSGMIPEDSCRGRAPFYPDQN